MLRCNSARLATASLPRIFIVGGYVTPFIGKGSPLFIDKKHPDFNHKKNKNMRELLEETVQGTIDQANLHGKEELIDYLVVGNFIGELFCNQGHLGSALIGSLPSSSSSSSPATATAKAGSGKDNLSSNPLFNKPALRVEGACASGGLAVMSAVDALRGGRADVAMATGVEIQTTASARIGGDYLARAAHYDRQRGIDDFTFPCLFAKRMKYILQANHFTMEDTALVAAKAYANANKNPLAHMHTRKLTYDDCNKESDRNVKFLGNEEYKPYLRTTDCSQVSDGGAGMILVNEAGLQKMGLSANDARLVELKSLACATGNLYDDPVDATRMFTSHAAAQRALQSAGIKPDQLNVAEVHDCFSIAELLMYEALGIAEYGKAKDLIRSGATCLDGRIPVNTGGGLLAFGHPVGATGVKQLMEVYRQMKGLCGEYQLKNKPEYGATLNMGGDDKTAVSCVLHNI